jgi:hypothetical protein
MQTVQCVRKVPYTVCKQVPVTTTRCVPVQVCRTVKECKTVCVPKTICKQVPVCIMQKVPVVTHCPAVVRPSAQSVLASAQCDVPETLIPPCDPCDKKHPLLGLGKIFHRY